MKPWQAHIDLAPYTTFGVPARCQSWLEADTFDEAIEALDAAERQGLPTLVLGGGSNVLFTRDFPGLVVRMNQRGVRYEHSGTTIRVTAAAGQPWHPLVLDTLAHGAFGLENLALIPGTVGAAPMQNIGAYGVEIKDVLESVLVWNRVTRQRERLSAADCRFAYRDSLFKQQPGHYLILEVTFALSSVPRIRLGYADLVRELEARGIAEPGPRDVCDVIVAVRSRKLPDPARIGNAGSFFKNPVVDPGVAAPVLAEFPAAPQWPLPDGRIKLAAGWLIERCGWKGRSLGPVGAYEHQALVLVNHGGATGADVVHLARLVQDDVRQRFGIELEAEPLIL